MFWTRLVKGIAILFMIFSIIISVLVGWGLMNTLDDNVGFTIIIAGVALYEFGSGDVRGFALTLMIGIIISIITATIVTNVYLQLMAESRIFGTKKMFGIKDAPAAVSEEVKEAL